MKNFAKMIVLLGIIMVISGVIFAQERTSITPSYMTLSASAMIGNDNVFTAMGDAVLDYKENPKSDYITDSVNVNGENVKTTIRCSSVNNSKAAKTTEFKGDVKVVRSGIIALADNAIYEQDSNTICLTGNIVLKAIGNEIKVTKNETATEPKKISLIMSLANDNSDIIIKNGEDIYSVIEVD